MIRPLDLLACVLGALLLAVLVIVHPAPAPLDPRYPWAVACRPLTCGGR